MPEAEAESAVHHVSRHIWDSVVLFLSLQTQWRIGIGFGGHVYQGFDYAGVAAFLQVTKVKKKKRVMKDLQIMEAAALPVLNGSSPEPEDCL